MPNDYAGTLSYAMSTVAEMQRLDGYRQDSDGMPAVVLLNQQRLDAHSAGQLQEQVTKYYPDLLRDEYPEYKYPNGLVPIDGSEYIGIDRHVRTRISRTGQWRRSSAASTPLSPIDIGLTEVEYGSVEFDAKITFTVKELDRIDVARRMRDIQPVVNTVAEKIRAMRESYQELMNRILAFGSPNDRVYGLHNHPGLVKVRSPYRMGYSQTSDANIAILTMMLKGVNNNSGQRSKFDVLLFPENLAIDLDGQIRSTSADKSTLKYFAESMYGKNIAIASTPEMDTAGPGGTPAIQGYRLDRRRIQACVPKRMRQVAPPYYLDGKYHIECKCELGGVHNMRPYDQYMMYDIYDNAA